MDSVVTKLERRFHDVVNLVLAILLFVSPWVLSFTGASAAAWNAWTLGVLVALVALFGLAGWNEWPEWVTAVLGVWTFVAPWILGFAAVQGAFTTHLALGALMVAFAAWGIWSVHHPGTKVTA